MKALKQNVENWLRREAHVMTGHSFLMGDCSCLPVVPENQIDEETPVGFLVTRGGDVTYVAAQTPVGERMMSAWAKNHSAEMEESQSMPSEYWYG